MHIKVAIKHPDELVCLLRLLISGIGDISDYNNNNNNNNNNNKLQLGCHPVVVFILHLYKI